MARITPIAPRSGGPLRTVVRVVLLAVLTALLAAPCPHPLDGTVRAAVASVSAQALSYADDADSAVSTTAARSPRETTGERPSPPLSVPVAAHVTAADLLRSSRTWPTVPHPASSDRPANRHGTRAPPRAPAPEPLPSFSFP
ncbi:hypothetical protein OG601_38570 [Streptomyces sp. NBC_01239]|uniref:hypothetical protein n=1 Tax=Streptomyces sp. NBC_01239 TaxID=2903792 RepID=UPI00225B1775|nr:hypothetical protein [Streptomyces sp. NBC_01239]MCX4816514.1 hypothetical protein [Streptomyces sp. NBC_01239]